MDDSIKMLFLLGLIGIGIIIKLFNNYRKASKQRELLGLFEKVTQKHTVEEFNEIVKWEQELRTQFVEQKMLLKAGKITENEYLEATNKILDIHTEIQTKYNVTGEEMKEYFLQATRSS